MKKIITIVGFLCSFPIFGSLISEINSFHSWLDIHQQELERCQLERAGDSITLCDKTVVSLKEMKQLFAMSAQELVQYIKDAGINLEISCASTSGPFDKHCQKHSKRKAFKKRYHLHGQFLGRENTILLRSDALKGSLIHEYVHYLEFNNKNLLWGRRYKFERVELEKKIIVRMDEIIAQVKDNEARLKKEGKLKGLLKEMVAISGGLQKFSKWQDLIDERNIFMLYIKWGDLFGATDQDVALAKKNMNFICKRSDFKSLPKNQCPKLKIKKSHLEEVKQVISYLRPKPNFELLDKFIQGINPKKKESLKQTVKRVKEYIYNDWKMVADTSYKSISKKDNILPDTTLDTHHAHCVGLSTLYLLAFEKLGISAELIRIPRHVLVQVCVGSECYYIETLKKGLIINKDFYFKNNYTTKAELEKTFYFKPAKLSSSLYLSLGFIANGAKQYELADILYKKSIDTDRRFADAYSNLAGVYQQQGKARMAKSYLEIALKVNPVHTSSLVNKALMLWNSEGNKAKKNILELLKKAQNINPSYIETYRVRSIILEKLGKFKKSFVNQLVVSLQQSKNCIHVERLFYLQKKIIDKIFLRKYLKDLNVLRKTCEI